MRPIPGLTISPEFRFHALGIAYLPSARALSLVEGQGTLAEPLLLRTALESFIDAKPKPSMGVAAPLSPAQTFLPHETIP